MSHWFDWTPGTSASFIATMKLFLVLIAIGQFAAAGLPRALGLGQGLEVRAVTGGIPPELPLGLFFLIIWNLIFMGYLVHALTAFQRKSFADDTVALPLAAAGALNIVWMLSAQFIGSLWLDLILLFPVMAAAWEASRRLDLLGGFDGTLPRLLICAVTGLLSGWITTAVSISIPDAIRELLGHHASDYVWRYLWLTFGCAALMAFAFTRWVSRSLWFFVGLGWGIAGIAANNLLRLDMPLLGYMAIFLGGLILYRRLVKGARGAAA